MRLLVAIVLVLFISCLCEGKHGKGKHHHLKHKSRGHPRKVQHHGNTSHKMKGKLDIHRADGCGDCPADHMCVMGKSTNGPTCVSADFIKEGKHLLKEFNLHHSQHFELKEPKPHLYDNKPHNIRLSVHTNKHTNEQPTDRIIVHNEHHHQKSKGHHKKGKKHHKKIKDNFVCTQENMNEMRQRLAGWFRLLHAQDRENHPHHQHHHHREHERSHISVKKELRNHNEGHCKCLKSVMWEMHHLDQNKDRQLNQTELNEIERNNMEPCLRPYLSSCDHNGNGILSSNEWCCCFSEVLPPCYNALRDLQEKVLRNEKDVFLPKCDNEGFYARQQCIGDHFKSRKCWCVDFNGNKIPHTETRGRAHCNRLTALGLPKPHH